MPSSHRGAAALILCLAASAALSAMAVRWLPFAPAGAAALCFGAVVAAALLISWAAEAMQFHVSQGLAVAFVALLQVVPEFMVEAVILSEMGGVLWIVLGIAGGNVVGMIADAETVIPWDWAVIGMVVCSLVGILFGVYPAWKASTLDPIEALRYE